MSDPTIAPLAGVRVIELGNYIAAPTGGRLLADFGAEVIKIERPGSGDELRGWRLYEGSTSMLFHTLNRNKKSVVLDLRSDAGREAVLELVRRSDVVIENFRPGTLERWGLGPDELNAANPEIIVSRVSAFGQTGPLADRPGFAAVAEAFSGFRNLVGDPDRAPVRVGVSIGDSIAGLYAAFGIVMSLFRRETARAARDHAANDDEFASDEDAAGDDTAHDPDAPGRDRADETTRGGGEIPLRERITDIALHEAMFSMLESLVPEADAYGVTRQRTGGRMEGIAPSNAYLCGDGASIVVAGNGDGIFRRYMAVIGRPDLGDDPDLQTNAARWERRDDLDDAIGAWTGGRTAAEALEALDAAGVPAGPIYTADDIVAEPQYQARNMLQSFDVEVTEGEARRVRFPGIVPVIGEASLPIRTLGPGLGAHTREVLGGLLGMDDDAIARASGISEGSER